MRSLRQDLGADMWRLADLVRADEGRRSFRAKAYRRSVWCLDDVAPDLTDPPQVMLAVPGIGPGVLKLIEEFRSTGTIAALDRLEALYPRDVARLRRLPRMTPAMLRSLKQELGVEEAGDLIAAVEDEGVETVRGIGASTAERWARILELAPTPRSLPVFQAGTLAGALERHLHRHLGARVWVAGPLRRMEEWIETIDLVVEVDDFAKAESFTEETAVARYLGPMGVDAIRLEAHEGVEVDVHLSPPGRSGAQLLEATGPGPHVDPLLVELDDDTLSESEIYARSGQVWIPPPARGLPGEKASAVVRMSDIRGDLHLHTDRSPDGRMSLDDILLVAVDRGYEYILITDHTSGLRFGGLDERALLGQRAEIDEARSRFPDLIVLQGAELNIDRDGSLDIDEDGLGLLDMAVAGVHSYFDLDRAAQTARVVTAMQHPVVRVLGHPTGRRIGIRSPVDLDLEAVIAAAAERQVALEVNGHQDRLDLSAGLAAMAVEAGAQLAANSDAHRIGEIGNIANSVATMQKAGVGMASVINTLPADRFQDWISRSGTVSR